MLFLYSDEGTNYPTKAIVGLHNKLIDFQLLTITRHKLFLFLSFFLPLPSLIIFTSKGKGIVFFFVFLLDQGNEIVCWNINVIYGKLAALVGMLMGWSV